MSLEDELAKVRAAGASRIPDDIRAIMGKATQDLRETGIVDRAIKVGDALPPFELSDVHGSMVSSQNLLEKGAVVLTVFRGHW